MSAPLRDIPILLIDVIDFSKAGSLANQRQLLETLQRLASASGKFFMPYGDPWKKWQRQGTGDGYYFLFDNLDASVALEYALRLDAALAQYNAGEGVDLPLRLRMVLVHGDAEYVDDQILSDEFVLAKRLIDDETFRDSARQRVSPNVVWPTRRSRNKFRCAAARTHAE
jgi:hypothetical protein